MNNTVYILDSYGLIYRAYFALINHPLTNSSGNNISAIVIFFKNLKALLSKDNPAFLAAAFDSCTKTFRHEMYPEYKATRQKTPEDLHAQVPVIEEILTALGVPVLRKDGFEADDLIATVAKKCRQTGRGCRVLSADKDLLQLVDDLILQMQPDKNNGGWETIDKNKVLEKWGIGPEGILDYLSLVGDTADNVPGVKGVGDKTALKLLNQYNTLDGIYEHAQEIKGALGEKIRNDKENAYFSKQLITLKDDVDIEIDFDSFRTDNLNYSAAASLLQKWGAYSIAKTYASSGSGDLFDSATVAASQASASAPSQTDASQAASDSAGNSSDASQPVAPDTPPAVPVVQNKGNYRAVTDAAQLNAFIDSILSDPSKEVAFDTETDSLDTHTCSLVGFSLTNKTGEGIYVPVILSGGMFAPPTVSRADSVKALSRIFDDSAMTLVMHNAKFDMQVLATNGYSGDYKCSIFDTMVAAWLIDSAAGGKSPYSLEALSEKHLHLKGIEYKELVGKGQTFADVPLEKAAEYGAEDSDFTWQLYLLFKTQMEEKNLHGLFYDLEMQVLPILYKMEQSGIHLDTHALEEYSKVLQEYLDDKEKKIYSIVGHEFNIASPKQLQTVLFEELGLPHGKKTKTGYSTDTEVLEELARINPVPREILDYRAMAKLQSTYVEALPKLCDKNSLLHTSFMQTGTATGRLSSVNPNLQNIPVRSDEGRKIRAAFTSHKGRVLISADYSQIELVVLAHLSGDKNLSASFIDGVDVHRATASLVYGVAPDQITPDQRRFAKTVNFGVMYGMSAFRLSNELNISRTQAKDFIDRYFANYSGVKSLLDKIINDAKEKGYVETIFGRRRSVPEIQNKNKLIMQSGERIAVNTPIQGSAADIVKTAMIKVDRALKESGSSARMLLQVHDELIFECDDNEEEIKKNIDIIRTQMEGAVKLNVPLKVSIEWGHNWGEFH